MTIRERFIEEALQLLEGSGPKALTTRAVCDRVGVKAPTLYHHFGDAAGLLDAAVNAGFLRFLEHKRAQKAFEDPADDLLAGWDNYLEFARQQPALYAAMAAKFGVGESIPAAEQAWSMLFRKVEAVANAGRLTVSPAAAAEIVLATAYGASMLIVKSAPDNPTAEAIASLRASIERLISSPPSGEAVREQTKDAGPDGQEASQSQSTR
ncbi:TetR/AcrR family transcriptional regulator [Tistrella mobilis]|uniref:TetR/AcrR family transcriptional regulator n=1 Tax=Tistrella mobilis TaxID=171437 RepID=UPI003556DF59